MANPETKWNQAVRPDFPTRQRIERIDSRINKLDAWWINTTDVGVGASLLSLISTGGAIAFRETELIPLAVGLTLLTLGSGALAWYERSEINRLRTYRHRFAHRNLIPNLTRH